MISLEVMRAERKLTVTRFRRGMAVCVLRRASRDQIERSCNWDQNETETALRTP